MVPLLIGLQAPEYRQLLIQSIHVCAIKFSEVAASVVHALMEFLGDSNNPSALDVVAFVRYVTWHTFLNIELLTIGGAHVARSSRNSQPSDHLLQSGSFKLYLRSSQGRSFAVSCGSWGNMSKTWLTS